METVNWSKLDLGLRQVFIEWQHANNSPEISEGDTGLTHPDTALTVLLEHNGELEPQDLLKNGFTVTGQVSNRCYQGDLPLKNLVQIVRLEDVMLVRFGTEMSLDLENSQNDIKARATSASLADGVWHYDSANDVFTGNTGSNVVIGIIDSGIDFTHPCFQNISGNTSRIHAIWDQFLSPETGENSPVVGLLGTGTTVSYGVEYSHADINGSPSRVRHRDIDGHGTHVAGIAGGNGAVTVGGTLRRSENIGVAPGVRLIVVKLFEPCSRTRHSISYDIRARDAYHYIIKKAAALFGGDVSVVVNCSFGSTFSAHDGRGEQGSENLENHLHSIFYNEAGRICVASAGNNSGQGTHLKVTLPNVAGGIIDIPFTILDTRTRCIKPVPMMLDVWYPETTNGIQGWVRLPGDVDFFGSSSPYPAAGTALGQEYEKQYGSHPYHTANIYHESNTVNSPYGDATRHRLMLHLTPRRNRHHRHNFTFRIGGAPGTILHLWVNSGRHHKVAIDLSAFPTGSGVEVENKSTIGSPGQSPAVIAVAAYDVNPDGTPFVAYFSSRGPLLSHDVNQIIADKPDVIAPGVGVNSASVSTVRRALSPSSFYVPLSGASMATPHIAGLVALMLNKNKTLTKSQILQAMNSSLTSPMLFLPLNHDPTPGYTADTYSIPAVGAAQAGMDEAGVGRINYKVVLDQITAAP